MPRSARRFVSRRISMRTRILGACGLELTTVGLGAWAIGGGGWAFGWGPQDDGESIAAIRRGLDLGINWIDTAAVYGLGHSEEVVARAIEGHRDEVIVATKCGLVWNPGETTPFGRLKAESIRKEAEDSLRRLRTDRIDLYQIHWPNPAEDIEEAWGEIARLVQEGKVLHAGVSNFTVEQLERIRAVHPVASLQPPYSLLNRNAEAELLPYCRAHGIGVVVYSPMQAGILSGAFTRARMLSLPADDWRRNTRQYQEPLLTQNLGLVERLRAIASRMRLTVGQLAIAWVLRREEVTCAIVGARRPSQIEETSVAADVDLTSEIIAEVNAALR
jgi:aryl-alcohol dehydrogenase-like predicted oxidoreductase